MRVKLVAMAAAAALAGAAAFAQSERRTDMIDEGGKAVDSLLLRYHFDAMWALDTSHILLRDTYRDHYLLTLAKPCEKLNMDRGVAFVPNLNGRVRASISYEVRDPVAAPCDIASIRQVAKQEAIEMKASLSDKG